MLVRIFKRSFRVLVGGEIHITEMNTPNFIPDEWFIGGRPDRKSDIKVEANPDYFQQFGLRAKNCPLDENDIKNTGILFRNTMDFIPSPLR